MQLEDIVDIFFIDEKLHSIVGTWIFVIRKSSVTNSSGFPSPHSGPDTYLIRGLSWALGHFFSENIQNLA
jgi:hypothetical protein